MAVLGVSLRIDVTKIDKEKLYKGAKGTYLDVTTFIDTDTPDQYGNNGMVTQSTTQEEREAGVKGAILGNNKVFMNKGAEGSSKPKAAQELESFEDMPF
tara:strand:- start:2492 stop:2788 length:297 start_codon:yes stop_codon:yes gene_type:complete